MTTMTMTTTFDRLAPGAWVPEPGEQVQVVPDTHPLWYRAGDGDSRRHGLYTGTFRPTIATVVRREGNTDPTGNVRVTFTDNLGVGQETWAYVSELRPLGHTEGGVDAINAFMLTDIGSVEWPGAGTPTGWGPYREGWFTAGNTAVLAARALIESGGTTAGRVWCEAANRESSFHYTQATQDFLHEWFVNNREHLLSLAVQTLNEGEATLTVVDPVVEIGGVKYVPLDVVEKDIATMQEVIHKGADENGLCGVYDKVMAKSDEATTFLKMGSRPKVHVVRMSNTTVTTWYARVTASTPAEAERMARENAPGLRAFQQTAPEGVEGWRSRPGETIITGVES